MEILKKKLNPVGSIRRKKMVTVELNPNCKKVFHNGANTAMTKTIVYNGIVLLVNLNHDEKILKEIIVLFSNIILPFKNINHHLL